MAPPSFGAGGKPVPEALAGPARRSQLLRLYAFFIFACGFAGYVVSGFDMKAGMSIMLGSGPPISVLFAAWLAKRPKKSPDAVSLVSSYTPHHNLIVGFFFV